MMQKINFKEDLLPHIIAILVFLVVTIGYFKPVFFDNKALNQHDILQWRGGAQELLDYREAHGEEALWTNSMFSGMPGYLITTTWGIGVPKFIQSVISVGLPHPARIIFISFISFYILLLVFRVRPYLAIAGALAFGLSSFDIIGIGAGHNSRIAAIAYMPMVLAGVHLAFNRSRLGGMALAALALTLQLHVNHLQITYYLALIILAYLIVQGISAVRNKSVGDYVKTGMALALAAIIAVGTFFGTLSSTFEYSKYSIRGTSELHEPGAEDANGLSKSYAFEYSDGIFEPMTLMIPNIMGGAMNGELDGDSEVAFELRKRGMSVQEATSQAASIPTYFGNQPFTSPYYAGAITVFLFVLGLLVHNRKTLAWTVPMIILGIMLSWGSNFASFNYFMFDHFPGYNKFRSVTFALIIPILLMNFLGFTSLEEFFQSGFSKQNLKKLLIALSVTGGLCLLIIVGAGAINYSGTIDSRLPDWLLGALHADRQSLVRGDAFRSMIFIILTAGAIYASFKTRLSTSTITLGLAFLVLIDLWTVDKRYLGEDKFERSPERTFFNATDADNLIKQDKSDFRVLNLLNPWNEARTSYHHHSIGGYHGAKIRRYQDLISHGLSAEHQSIIKSLQDSGTIPDSLPLMSMLNAKYYVFGPSARQVVVSDNTYGNAWLANKVATVASADEELKATVNNQDKNTAVIDESKFKTSTTTFSASGDVSLTSYQPNELKYKANLDNNGLIVFSEIYYPHGWKATIDGKEAKILRANYVLRALEIPAGTHEIVFRFEPQVYTYGNLVSTISSIILVLLLLGTAAIELGFIKQPSK